MIFLCCIEIRVSGNFPETAWRAIHSRQATHDIFVIFLGSKDGAA